jgi:hypothetical protein
MTKYKSFHSIHTFNLYLAVPFLAHLDSPIFSRANRT